MDIDEVVDLATSAAESVLHFHIVTSRRMALSDASPFIDFKAFQSAIQTEVKRLATKKRQRHGNGHDGNVPWLDVSEIAGDAAFRAATKWNALSHPTNHVRPEWLRGCVHGLVDGAVHSIVDSTTAIPSCEQQIVRPVPDPDHHEYLDPLGDSVKCRLDSSKKSLREKGLEQQQQQQQQDETMSSMYGFERGSEERDVVRERGVHDKPQQQETEAHPAHFVKSAWIAINLYAANPFSSDAAAKCQATLSGVVSRKRTQHEMMNDSIDEQYSNEEEEDGDYGGYDEYGKKHGDMDECDEDEDEEQVQGDQHKNKRRLRVYVSPQGAEPRRAIFPDRGPLSDHTTHNMMTSSYASSLSPRKTSANMNSTAALMPRSGNARMPKKPWTKQEEITLVSARQDGKTWTAIHELLGTRTATACEKKYRDLNLSSQYQQQQQQVVQGGTTSNATASTEEQSHEEEESSSQVASSEESDEDKTIQDGGADTGGP